MCVGWSGGGGDGDVGIGGETADGFSLFTEK